MSPFGSPCPHIDQRESFVFCKIYDDRPDDCRNHRYPFRHCPIGIDKVGLNGVDAINRRIDTGLAMITTGLDNSEEALEKMINAPRNSLFDTIPEDQKECFQCAECKTGSVSKTGNVWTCDQCEFTAHDRTNDAEECNVN